MKLLKPNDYKNLVSGETYSFTTFRLSPKGTQLLETEKFRGVLIYISSKIKSTYSDTGKLLSQELVGDILSFIPEEKTFVRWGDQQLLVHKTVVTTGMFRVFG